MEVFNREAVNLFIRVAQSCNLNCTHCFTMGDRDPIRILDPKISRSFCNSIKENVDPEQVKIYLHGGEPFLAPVSTLKMICSDALSYFPQAQVTIQSNFAFPITDEQIKFMQEECNGFVATSWDADIRYRSEKQERLFFSNLQKLKDNGIKYAVHITIQKELLKRDPIEVIEQFPDAELLEFEHLTVFDERTESIRANNGLWNDWFLEVTSYYHRTNPKWVIPLIDVFNQNIKNNEIFGCKCNCCADASFTLNVDGNAGLCGDNTYWSPMTSVKEMATDWKAFEEKAIDEILRRKGYEPHSMCYDCDLFEYCGGNIEHETFDDSGECIMGRKALRNELNRRNI